MSLLQKEMNENGVSNFEQETATTGLWICFLFCFTIHFWNLWGLC